MLNKPFNGSTPRIHTAVTRSLRSTPIVAILGALSIAPSVSAEEQVGAGLRWFDIEVLVFKQTPQYHSDSEQFPLRVQPVPLTRHIDLLGQQRAGQQQASDRSLAGLMVPCPDTEARPSSSLERFVVDEPVLQTESQLDAVAQAVDEQSWLPILTNYHVDSQSLTDMATQDVLCQQDQEFAFVETWYRNPNVAIVLGPREVADTVIDGPGGDMYRTRSPFLLPASELELTALRDRLASQSGKQPLLHTVWRQPVFNRNQGRKIRLFGGENFTRDFEYLGFAREHHLTPLELVEDADRIRQDSSPLAQLDRLLQVIENGNTPFSRPDAQALGLPERPESTPANLPQDAWEFDGLMHVYLVGNFLHVHGEFNVREEVEVPLQATSLQAQADAALREEEATEAFLRAYYFDQLRRVISHETHYMDHPHIGVVVQIRRTELSARR